MFKGNSGGVRDKTVVIRIRRGVSEVRDGKVRGSSVAKKRELRGGRACAGKKGSE